LRKIADIFSSLIANDYSLMTPLVVVENALSRNERILYGVLGDLEELVIKNNVMSPAVIILGDVVKLSQGWSLENTDTFNLIKPLDHLKQEFLSQ